MSSVPEEVHGVNIQRFIDSIGALMQSPSVRRKSTAYEQASTIVKEMENLTDRGRQDVYTLVSIGVSFILIGGLSIKKNKSLKQMKVVKDLSLASSLDKEKLHIDFPEREDFTTSPLKQARKHRMVSTITHNGVVPVVSQDLSIITDMLVRGDGSVPLVSVKEIPDNLNIEEYKLLFDAMVELCSHIKLKG